MTKKGKVLTLIISFLLFSVIYSLRIDNVAGQIGDDGWYALIAKALATGSGYTLLNSTSQGVMPTYPPAYPFLLSLIWKIAPTFPGNIILLKLLSVVAMAVAGFLAYKYFALSDQIPATLQILLALITCLSPALVFLATSTLMSESVCLLFLIMTVLIVESNLFDNNQKLWWVHPAFVAICSSLTFLTRSMWVTLIAAIFIYFIKLKKFRSAMVYLAIVLLTLTPWLFYVAKHSPTVAQKEELNSNVVYSYSEQFWMKSAGVPESGAASPKDIWIRFKENLANIFFRDTGCIVFPSFYRGAESSGIEVLGLGVSNNQTSTMGMSKLTIIASGIVSMLMLAGFLLGARRRLTLPHILLPLSILMIAFWPWFSFRFIVLYSPFLLLYLFIGLSKLIQFLRLGNIVNQRIAIIGVAAIVLFMIILDHGAYILGKQRVGYFPPPVFPLVFEETRTTLSILDHITGGDEVIGTDSPAQVTLFANRKAIRCGEYVIRNDETIVNGDPIFVNNMRLRCGEDSKIRYLAKVSPFSPIELDNIGNYTLLYSSPVGVKILDLRSQSHAQTETRSLLLTNESENSLTAK